MSQKQENQRESVNALNEINFKLGDLSSTLGTIADLCEFYGEYDNLDDQSRRADAFHRLRQMAEKAQEDTLTLANATCELFPVTEDTL